jgi:purine nucleosidase
MIVVTRRRSGENGLGEVYLPEPTTASDPRPAAQFIVDMVMQHPGEITLAPVGPLTNIALALLLEPRIVERVAGVALMGKSLKSEKGAK